MSDSKVIPVDGFVVGDRPGPNTILVDGPVSAEQLREIVRKAKEREHEVVLTVDLPAGFEPDPAVFVAPLPAAPRRSRLGALSAVAAMGARARPYGAVRTVYVPPTEPREPKNRDPNRGDSEARTRNKARKKRRGW